MGTLTNCTYSKSNQFGQIVTTSPILREIIEQDLFDNIFLGLATVRNASLIISGDRHLFLLKSYKGIQIVTPSEGINVISNVLK